MLSMRSDNFSRLSLNLPSASAAAAAPFPPDLSVSISEYASDNSSATNSETMTSNLISGGLRSMSGLRYPRGLNPPYGSCPCLPLGADIYGPHLLNLATEDLKANGSGGPLFLFLNRCYRRALGFVLNDQH